MVAGEDPEKVRGKDLNMIQAWMWYKTLSAWDADVAKRRYILKKYFDRDLSKEELYKIVGRRTWNFYFNGGAEDLADGVELVEHGRAVRVDLRVGQRDRAVAPVVTGVQIDVTAASSLPACARRAACADGGAGGCAAAAGPRGGGARRAADRGAAARRASAAARRASARARAAAAGARPGGGAAREGSSEGGGEDERRPEPGGTQRRHRFRLAVKMRQINHAGGARSP